MSSPEAPTIVVKVDIEGKELHVRVFIETEFATVLTKEIAGHVLFYIAESLYTVNERIRLLEFLPKPIPGVTIQ